MDKEQLIEAICSANMVGSQLTYSDNSPNLRSQIYRLFHTTAEEKPLIANELGKLEVLIKNAESNMSGICHSLAMIKIWNEEEC